MIGIPEQRKRPTMTDDADDGRLERVVIGRHARDVDTTGNTDSALSAEEHAGCRSSVCNGLRLE